MPLRGKRVLLVEDEFLVALDIETELEDRGASVVCASTLAQARVKAENDDFDVAVLDLNLHGEASYPVADLLNERHIPFLFHTGQGEKSALTRRYPGVTVCSKPCDGNALAGSLRRVIDATPRSQPRVAALPASAAPPPGTASPDASRDPRPAAPRRRDAPAH